LRRVPPRDAVAWLLKRDDHVHAKYTYLRVIGHSWKVGVIDDAKRYVAILIKLILVHEILPGFKRAMKKCARSITSQGRFTAYILPLPNSEYRLRLLSRRTHGCLSCKRPYDILRVDQLLTSFTYTDVNDNFV
jgi:hypothetical protein